MCLWSVVYFKNRKGNFLPFTMIIQLFHFLIYKKYFIDSGTISNNEFIDNKSVELIFSRLHKLNFIHKFKVENNQALKFNHGLKKN